MPGLEAGAGVEVPVVLRQEVHVVEYEAVPGKVLHGLHKANVQEGPSVELVRVSLQDSAGD